MKKTIIIFTCSISLVVLWTLIFKCSLDVIVPTAIAFVSWILDKYLTEAFTVNANGAFQIGWDNGDNKNKISGIYVDISANQNFSFSEVRLRLANNKEITLAHHRGDIANVLAGQSIRTDTLTQPLIYQEDLSKCVLELRMCGIWKTFAVNF
jgi:hypothetical protein